MTAFNQALREDLQSLREQGLFRHLRRVDSAQSPRVELDGFALTNFSSNDYLGLANHPTVKQAAVEAVQKYGAGSGASRSICGSLAPHHELEEEIAAFKGTEGALVFSSGFAAAIGTIGAVVGPGDVIVIDRLAHASIIDAARLCGAKLRVFAHNDLDALEKILRWAVDRRNAKTERSRILIATESVFSMDGDLAPLTEIVSLKDKYGAWLFLDEAHAAGLFGENRRGLAEAFGLADRVEIQFGTLGKAIGSAGGYVAGSRSLIDVLINRARSFIFSTAPVPAASAAATAGIRLVRSAEGEQRRQQCWRVVDLIKNALVDLRWPASAVRSAIIPLIIGPETKAVEAAEALYGAGVYIPAIRYPTVARGSARLRISASAAHRDNDVQLLTAALSRLDVSHRQEAVAS